MTNDEYQKEVDKITLQREAYIKALVDGCIYSPEHAAVFAKHTYPLPTERQKLRVYNGYKLKPDEGKYELMPPLNANIRIFTKDEIEAIVNLYGNEYVQGHGESTELNMFHFLAHIPESNIDSRVFSQRETGRILREMMNLDTEDNLLENPLIFAFPEEWYYVYTSSFLTSLFGASLQKMSEYDFRRKYIIKGINPRAITDVIHQIKKIPYPRIERNA